MRRLLGVAAGAVVVLAGCGGGGSDDGGSAGSKTTTIRTTEVVREGGGRSGGGSGLDAEGIYAREAPGVVTIFSVGGGGGAGGGLGSGFVLNGRGEIATNAHVVTDGEGTELEKVDEVYVEFSDGNRVPATIRGFDPNADVALIKVDPAGLDLNPLPLGDSESIRVGAPVAAIGSPFGEKQSLSVGIVSATDRDVESLTKFSISGAIQTDAAINPGNSGGPLVDADGEVLGLNQQIETESGSSAGVGFAVPIDLAKRSLAQLREQGRVDYAFIGVSTTDVYPQLAEKFGLATQEGAWVQTVNDGGPADDAGFRAGDEDDAERFQAQSVIPGGDVITSIAGIELDEPNELGRVVARLTPGETVPVVLQRDGKRRTVRLKLAKRPDDAG